MKRAVILGVYVAIAVADAAIGQNSSVHVKTAPTYHQPLPSMEKALSTSSPLLEQLASQSAGKTAEIARMQIRPSGDGSRLEMAALSQPVVMHREIGGSIPMHENRFRAMARTGAKVEMRGPCYSACTLLTAYIPKERLCFGQGSFLAFHAASSDPDRRFYDRQATMLMYQSYPAEIKSWIDRRGGWEQFTTHEYWTLYDRDLWAMGYPKCK
jgi:hypothetical protein